MFVGLYGKRVVLLGVLLVGIVCCCLKCMRYRLGFYNDESEGDFEEGDYGSFMMMLGVGVECIGSLRWSSVRFVKRRK